MNIHNVNFVKSAAKIEQRPLPLMPEVAVVGRSNVGKSSLINTLFNRKNLAKISSTPGKTRLINYFMVDEKFYFVDLPGYGFAKLPKAERVKWQQNIEAYLRDNKLLKLVFLLIDARHLLLKSDQDMLNWLTYYKIPFSIILTKSDKVSNNQLPISIANLKKSMPGCRIVVFSSSTKRGREDLILEIETLFA